MKKNLILIVILLVIGLMTIFAHQTLGGDSNSSIFKEYQFPTYPNLTHLCEQNVMGLEREINWHAFSSNDSPNQILDYYRKKLGKDGFLGGDQSGTWKLPVNSEHPTHVLDILSIEKDNPSRQCDKAPRGGSRSVVIISRSH